ncbi:MAG: hypothetical protein CML20_07310 [Rheinheimera sp.]|uniref:DUF6689 family protein n=1 Tax=Arsukibacterium sp. UBA3155 TaxID=1946058 RepID=UPI000C92F002|nr:DUF6689 family protein [Arsukibacterium sp. UBA3155]MAD74581.1 hypothetical protein [Rheinheimera sp.]|tara:strand:- start:2159 stop:2974 length:816 start_codon:yes stop_codon:yes gene_type:complete
MFRLLLLGTALLLNSLSLFASDFPININGKTAQTTVSLPGGYEVDLALTFENVMGLTAENLNITAYVASPLSADILNRLPNNLISLQAAYPLVLRIEPLADSGFSFSGPLTIDLHTHNLQYSVNTPLRLYKSHAGAAFEDITIATGAGSIRAKGQMGNLSDFIIVADLRPVAQVITDKSQKLDTLINNFADQIAPELLGSLQNSSTVISNHVQAGRYKLALAETKQLQQLISGASSTQMPDVWRSARDIDNVAGMLAAASATLAYSLRLSL